MKIATVIGARPQFIKAAPLSRELRKRHTEVLIHTGQHYDDNMSAIFFRELAIPESDYNLNIGSGSHGAQTGAMLAGIEEILVKEKPDLLLVYGDTNSTIAGALAAAKLHIPVAHVEAGLRSFNRTMPEEINRIMTDHISDLLFVPSESARLQLEKEGLTRGVHNVGDIMYDAVLMFSERARRVSEYPGALNLTHKGYYLCTVHRAENTDNPEDLKSIFATLGSLDRPVLLPLHPRTQARVTSYGICPSGNIIIVAPFGYLDMLNCIRSAACILTDSGGLQKEAYYLEVPCITLRTETEWKETVDVGWNIVTGTDPDKISRAIDSLNVSSRAHPDLYGNGKSAAGIVSLLDNICEGR